MDNPANPHQAVLERDLPPYFDKGLAGVFAFLDNGAIWMEWLVNGLMLGLTVLIGSFFLRPNPWDARRIY